MLVVEFDVVVPDLDLSHPGQLAVLGARPVEDLERGPQEPRERGLSLAANVLELSGVGAAVAHSAALAAALDLVVPFASPVTAVAVLRVSHGRYGQKCHHKG